MIAKINKLLQEVEALTASNAEELEALRIKYLSKKGAINELMADFRSVPAEQKKEVGMKLNELKNKAEGAVRKPGYGLRRPRPDTYRLPHRVGHTPPLVHRQERNH